MYEINRCLNSKKKSWEFTYFRNNFRWSHRTIESNRIIWKTKFVGVPRIMFWAYYSRIILSGGWTSEKKIKITSYSKSRRIIKIEWLVTWLPWIEFLELLEKHNSQLFVNLSQNSLWNSRNAEEISLFETDNVCRCSK